MTLSEIKPLIATFFKGKPVLRAYIFGSYARGEEVAASDVDVLVELDYANGGADFYNYLDMMDNLAEQLGKRVDLVSANGLSKHIAPYIHRDKILVYDQAH